MHIHNYIIYNKKIPCERRIKVNCFIEQQKNLKLKKQKNNLLKIKQ